MILPVKGNILKEFQQNPRRQRGVFRNTLLEGACVGFLRVAIVAKVAETIKNFLQKPSKDPLKHQSLFKSKRVRDFTLCRF